MNMYCTKANGLAILQKSVRQQEKKSVGNDEKYIVYGESGTTYPQDDQLSASAIELTDSGWFIGCTRDNISPAHTIESVAQEAQVTPPEMVFGLNQMVFFHSKSGISIQFNAIEALKATHFDHQNRPAQQLKVKLAKKLTTSNSPASMLLDVKELDIPYDWTYTTNYSGSTDREDGALRGESATDAAADRELLFKPTDQCINFMKLKERETILWFDEIALFEDELHDHGVSRMTVKTRVMPSGFYCLAQFWMRLDHVMIRVHETRIHHLFETNYILREYTRKEATFEQLFAAGHPKSMAHYADIQTVQQILPVLEVVREKCQLF